MIAIALLNHFRHHAEPAAMPWWMVVLFCVMAAFGIWIFHIAPHFKAQENDLVRRWLRRIFGGRD